MRACADPHCDGEPEEMAAVGALVRGEWRCTACSRASAGVHVERKRGGKGLQSGRHESTSPRKRGARHRKLLRELQGMAKEEPGGHMSMWAGRAQAPLNQTLLLTWLPRHCQRARVLVRDGPRRTPRRGMGLPQSRLLSPSPQDLDTRALCPVFQAAGASSKQTLPGRQGSGRLTW